MIIANAIFYNGVEADKVYLGNDLVWEKTTPPTPTYGSKTFAGKFADDTPTGQFVWNPNDRGNKDISNYVDPITNEFSFEYDGQLTDCFRLFNYNASSSVAYFERIDHIPDTSQASTMGYMFINNKQLKSINFEGVNTSNVVGMQYMFYNCNALTSLDLSGFDTSKVQSMKGMFSGCSKLASLDLSNFDTSNVTDMSMMFNSIISLKTLDLSGWDVSKVTNMESLFNNYLTTLNISGWNFGNVVKSEHIFNTQNLSTVLGPISGISFNLYFISKLTNASAMVFINGLAEVTTAKTITFKATTYDTLTAEQIAVATSKGWNVVRGA